MSTAGNTVYLSYSWPDRGYAESLRASLANRDIASIVSDADDPTSSSLLDALVAKLKTARALIVLVGETTYRSHFVEHEARLARELQMPVVIVKLAPGFVLPEPLYDVQATWTDPSRCEDTVAAILAEHKGS
jgi:hypothetical protein